MSEAETYLTKSNPTVDDWVDFNSYLFASLRGEQVNATPQYVPLVDVDIYAEEAGVSPEEYLSQLKNRIGSLGKGTLRLVHSEMDGAVHIVVDLEPTDIPTDQLLYY